MKNLLSSSVMALMGSILVLPASVFAQGMTVSTIAPGGMKCPMDILAPAFEKKSGNTVKVRIGAGGATHRQVVQGEAFDVPIVQPPYKDVLDSGNVIAGTETPLATVAIVVAVRKNDPKPDISTPAAVKKMLLDAKSLSYPDGAGGLGGAAGISFDETQRKLGVFDQVQPKVKRAPRKGPIDLLVDGDIDVAITFASEIKNPNIVVVGPLPREISTPTGLVGFVSAHAQNPEVAKAFLKFLASSDGAAAYKECAMGVGR